MPSPPASNSGRATIPSRTGSSIRSPSPSQFFASYRDPTLGIFALLLGFRIVNALTLRTFFQPDEFFQSLEPAWQLAFGQTSNAWITWEWRSQLRSSLHPEIFAGVYLVAAKLAHLCGLSVPSQAELLLAAPKVTQAVCAALLDFYTWRLAEKVYGRASRTAFTTLALSVCSPWQWFCSTRTLSNCLETTITSIAVYHWPWHWPGPAARDRKLREQSSTQIAAQDSLGSLPQLRLSLLLAAFACILRPTNALIWVVVSIPTLWQSSKQQRYVLVREILFCGSAVLACSILSDRVYYQVWALPPLRFLYFNIVQSLAVFYGRNRPDYYLTEGLPLLLMTALPFALVGLGLTLREQPAQVSATDPNDNAIESTSTQPSKDAVARNSISSTAAIVAHRILIRLSWTSIIMTLALSLISHKEVRFLYPILPFLHVLSARPLASFLFSTLRSTSSLQDASHSTSLHPSIWRRAILILLLTINLLIASYASQVHQRGVLDVVSYLRHKHESRIDNGSNTTTTVGFLMPCHSTPWRSHLVHPSIHAWALTCEPPLDIPLSKRSSYLDEADQFYISPGPVKWLERHMDDIRSVSSTGSRSARHWANLDPVNKAEGRKAWPQNLVFFEQLEPELKSMLEGSRYKECWRGFNTHFHDDWRRKGKVVVWCLD